MEWISMSDMPLPSASENIQFVDHPSTRQVSVYQNFGVPQRKNHRLQFQRQVRRALSRCQRRAGAREERSNTSGAFWD
jgi:hypothetical protein